MKEVILPSEKVRVAHVRFCELQGFGLFSQAGTLAFWAFLKIPLEDVRMHHRNWLGNEDSVRMLELLLGPHAEALLKAHNIRQGK